MSFTSAAPKHVPSAAPSQPHTRPRDPYFDNTKLLLVTLVVVGHSWTLLPDNHQDRWLYEYLYVWHMPAFVLVTGYLSRSFRWSPSHVKRLFAGVLVPFVVFEAALVVFRRSMAGGSYHRLWIAPHWPMWFLVALLAWRIATPVLRSSTLMIPLAVLASLVSGLHQFDILELNRVFGFLPFFVLGLHADPDLFHRLGSRVVRRWAAGALLAGAVLPFLIDRWLSTPWVYYDTAYRQLGVDQVPGLAVRAGFLLVSAVLALSLLAWMPRGQHAWTSMGSASLVVYLCHGFFVKAAEYNGFPQWADGHARLALLVVTLAAVSLAWLLASPPVARRLNVVVDPLGRLIRPARGSAPAAVPAPPGALVRHGSR